MAPEESKANRATRRRAIKEAVKETAKLAAQEGVTIITIEDILAALNANPVLKQALVNQVLSMQLAAARAELAAAKPTPVQLPATS